MKVAITSGKAEGPSKLNAFDNALLDAGIGDVNLIKVSSILPKNTSIVELPKLTPGTMTNCVLSMKVSSNPGDLITAIIAVCTSVDDFGCVVEHSGINENPDKLKNEAIDMVKYMMNIRNLKIKELIIEEISHEVEELGAVVSSVVYLDD